MQSAEQTYEARQVWLSSILTSSEGSSWYSTRSCGISPGSLRLWLQNLNAEFAENIRGGPGEHHVRTASVARLCEISPSTIQVPSAIHSYSVKWPGIAGTTFMSNIAMATSRPKPATHHSTGDSFDWPGSVRARPI